MQLIASYYYLFLESDKTFVVENTSVDISSQFTSRFCDLTL